MSKNTTTTIDVEQLQRVLLQPVSTATAAWLIGKTPDAMRVHRMRSERRAVADDTPPEKRRKRTSLAPVQLHAPSPNGRRRIGYRFVDLLRFALEQVKRSKAKRKDAAK